MHVFLHACVLACVLSCMHVFLHACAHRSKWDFCVEGFWFLKERDLCGGQWSPVSCQMLLQSWVCLTLTASVSPSV